MISTSIPMFYFCWKKRGKKLWSKLVCEDSKFSSRKTIEITFIVESEEISRINHSCVLQKNLYVLSRNFKFFHTTIFFVYETAWKWVRDKGKQPTPTCMADKLELLWCKNCLGWEEFACLEEEEWDSSFPFTCEVEFWLVDGGMGGVWLTTCRVISLTSLNFSINCMQNKESAKHVYLENIDSSIYV